MPSSELLFKLHLNWSQIRGPIKYFHRFVGLTILEYFLKVQGQ